MAESYLKGWKTLWEKDKLLITSNFSFSPQCFRKPCFPGASKGVILWEWVKEEYFYYMQQQDNYLYPSLQKPCFSRDHNFLKESDKGSVGEHSCEIQLQSSERFQSRILKIALYAILEKLALPTKSFSRGYNFFKKSDIGSLKEYT